MKKETITLQVQSRTVLGKAVAKLRDQGLIPGVVYGHNREVSPISMPYNVFEKTYRSAGESSLIDLVIDEGASVKTLIQEVQYDSLSNRLIHVDFYEVLMTEKLEATIPLLFVGESPAVKQAGGTLEKQLSDVDVRCLPGDLIHEIEVDISAIKTFDDVIKIGDLVLPSGIEVLNDADNIVATVAAPISEEALKALEEKPVEDVTAVEVAEKGKKSDEATA